MKTKTGLTKETSQKVACGMPVRTQVQAGMTEAEYNACMKKCDDNESVPGFDVNGCKSTCGMTHFLN